MPRRTVKKILTTSPMFDETTGQRCEHQKMTETTHIRTQVTDELLRVVIDQPTLLNGQFDGSKVGVGKNHVRGELRNVRSATHCNTDISLLQRRCVVDTVTSLSKFCVSPVRPYLGSTTYHRDNKSLVLKKVDQLALVSGLCTAE